MSQLREAAIALREMRGKLEAMERARREPIAIVGMACRLPGGAVDPEMYWRLLQEGTDAVVDVPRDRWDLDALYDADPDAPGRMYCRQGGFLDNVDRFDPELFGISPREAVSMDPQQRLLLEVSWEAFENAGQAPDRLVGSATGVFVGIASFDYGQNTIFSGRPELIEAYCGTGITLSVAAGRVAYVFGLQGPTLSVDTACSSSLVAMHLAAQSLRLHECRMAVAGGVNVLTAPEMTIYFCKLKALSPNSRCRAFDAAADGYARGEGCGVVVLKRLSDAVADGDRVLAILRGSAVNHDGRSGGLTVPNGPAQERVIRQALADAGIEPDEVDYIETHGTGTPLGDPIEVHALAQTFGHDRPADAPLTIGSAKTNIGHLETAAGVAGLIKVVLALEHEEIPPHLHFHQWNPHIALDGAPIQVSVASTPWPVAGRKRLAGLSSFGMSGTNAHLVIEEAPDRERSTARDDSVLHLLTLSAKNQDALTALADRYQQRLSAPQPESMADITFTANTGRSQLSQRLAVIGKTPAELSAGLAAFVAGQAQSALLVGNLATGSKPRVAFLFTGQGSQYSGMGRRLYETEPVFRQALEQCDALLHPHLGRSVLSVMYPGASAVSDLIDQTALTQPALFALEYALAELWKSWGITPDIVIGHSVGEYVAACVAGVFGLEEGLRLIATRGRLMQDLPKGGAMAAVVADRDRVESAVRPYADQVSIAAVNAPNNVVISGTGTAVEALLAELTAAGVRAQRLTVSHAFHSPLMDPMLETLERETSRLTFNDPVISLMSNLTAAPVRPGQIDAHYWARHARETVRFADGIQSVSESGCEIFVEIGPSPTLCGLGRQTVSNPDAVWFPSLRRGRDDCQQLLEGLGTLYVRGAAVDWNGFHADRPGRRVGLPTYPFQRQRFWVDRISPLITGGVSPPVEMAGKTHPLLGGRIHTAGQEVIFQNQLQPMAPPFLDDHRVHGVVVFPATAYWAMALAAASVIDDAAAHRLTQVAIEHPLVLAEDGGRVVQLILTPSTGQATAFAIFSRANGPSSADGSWTPHAAGLLWPAEVSEARSPVSLDDLRAACAEELSVSEHYERMRKHGMQYGPAFQGVQQLWRGDGQCLARLELPAQLRQDTDQYWCHPALLDACLQVLGIGLHDSDEDVAFLPIALDQIEVQATATHSLWCHAVLHDESDSAADSLRGDLQLLDDAGRVLGTLEGIRLKRTTRQAILRAMGQEGASLMHEIRWRPIDPATPLEPTEPGCWMIFADAIGIGEKVASRLTTQGERVILVRPGTCFEGSEDRYAIDPLKVGDFERLFREVLSQRGLTCRGVVHLWGIDARVAQETTLESLQVDQRVGCGSVLHLVQTLVPMQTAAPRLWVATLGAQAVEAGMMASLSPVQSLLWGLGRVVANEHPELRCTLTDLESSSCRDAAAVLVDELWSSDSPSQVAYRHGVRYVPRLIRTPDTAAMTVPPGDAFQLQIGARGVLDNLRIVPITPRDPDPGELKIRVRATGLNFRDVLNALDLYPGDPGPLGGECAGDVVSVGDEEGVFHVGQRVVAIVPGSFASDVVTSSELVAAIPPGLSYEQAVTIPVAFITAHYALIHLGKLSAGEKVLIHAATGGVGQAALQLAKRAGAVIFATAGSPEKRAVLRALGVPHIMDSRSVEFASEVTRVTEGQGVDVILNSLAGDFIPKGLSSLSPTGRFLEIGKTEIWDETRIAETYPQVAYHAIALDKLAAERPAFVGGLLRDLMAEFATGSLTPLPLRVFPITDAVGAFRFMQHAKHIGKVVISQTDHDRNGMLRADATYLVTGGTGALGLLVAERFLEHGARSIVLMGRRGPSEETRSRIAAMTRPGVQVHCAAGDVSSPSDLGRVLNDIHDSMPPLRGVIHAAGVLDDGVLAHHDLARFETVLAPKVAGAWNLHTLTRGEDLDFFVLFSSVASILGGSGPRELRGSQQLSGHTGPPSKERGGACAQHKLGAVGGVGNGRGSGNRAGILGGSGD